MTSAICNTCDFKSISFGDVKPYLSDRENEFALYCNDNDNYTPMCSNCWLKQDAADTYLYNELKIPIKKLTWEKPFPKDHIAPIINNIITYNTNNFNTSNLTPTYNTTSNLTPTYNNTSNLTPTYNIDTTNYNTSNISHIFNTNKITRIIDPDGIIDPMSSGYNSMLKRANKYRAENKKKEIERLRKIREQETVEFNKKKESEFIKEQLRLLAIETEKDKERCAIREKEQLEEKLRNDMLHDNPIKLVINYNKKINKEKRDKKLYEIENIEKEYNILFGDHLAVEQPNEILKKYNKGFLTHLCCFKCKIIKAYPNGFVNSYNKLNEEKENDICTECTQFRSQKDIDNKSCNMVKCACGVLYYGATFEGIHKHESSPRHIKALGRNKMINGKTYSVIELRKICNVNIDDNGTLKVAGFSRMSKEQILEKLLTIDNLIIPDDLK